MERQPTIAKVRAVPVKGTRHSPFSAAEPGLGYIYQGRFALLKMLSLPESNSILIEKEDDVEFTTELGVKSLGSLKHKAVGDALTDLSKDFWKSVRIWLAHYLENGRISSDTRFLLFTTARISDSSFLKLFEEDAADGETRATAADEALERSQAQSIASIRADLKQLSAQELQDFYGRITIFDDSPRIFPRMTGCELQRSRTN